MNMNINMNISDNDYDFLVSLFSSYDKYEIYLSKDSSIEKIESDISEKHSNNILYKVIPDDGRNELILIKDKHQSIIIDIDGHFNYHICTFRRKKFVNKINKIIEKYEIPMRNLEIINKTL